MKSNTHKRNFISRRRIFPIIGSSLLIPFLGFGNSLKEPLSTAKDDAYQTLLKPDGTAVKVKVSTIKKSKIIKKNISNKSFLHWLGRKL